MNETEKLRLALKYKYKYKYKYEVKKHQDRSTPLLGDSWDLDPVSAASEKCQWLSSVLAWQAITQGGMGTGFDDSVALGQVIWRSVSNGYSLELLWCRTQLCRPRRWQRSLQC